MKPLVAAALLLGCAAWASAALGPAYGGRLRVGLVEPAVAGATGRVQGVSALVLAALARETLVRIGADGVAQPSLADRWSSTANGREWTLHLADRAVFHDGTRVTAHDAVRSLRRFLRDASPAALALAATLEGGPACATDAPCTGLAATDDSHLVLRHTSPPAAPLLPLSAPGAAIVGASGAGAGPFHPVGTGTAVSYLAFGAHVRGRPFLDAVDVVGAPDAPTLQADLRSGRVDVVPASSGPGAAPAATLLLVMDPAARELQDRVVRATIAGALEGGSALRPFLPSADFTPSLVSPALLPPLSAAPRASPRPPSALRLAMVVSRDVAPVVSQRVVAVLSALGITVEAQPASPADAGSARAPLRLLAWMPEVAEGGAALGSVAALASAPAPVRERLARAEASPTQAARTALLLQAAEALRAEHTVVALATLPVAFRARSGVHGIAVDLTGALRLDDAWLEP